jgi:hypothetical protein
VFRIRKLALQESDKLFMYPLSAAARRFDSGLFVCKRAIRGGAFDLSYRLSVSEPSNPPIVAGESGELIGSVQVCLRFSSSAAQSVRRPREIHAKRRT